MSITKKGSRRIVVDGTVYRWVIRRKPSRGQADYAEPLTFAVVQENIRGSLLHVKMNAARYDIMHDVPHSVFSPKTVAAAIRKALDSRLAARIRRRYILYCLVGNIAGYLKN